MKRRLSVCLLFSVLIWCTFVCVYGADEIYMNIKCSDRFFPVFETKDSVSLLINYKIPNYTDAKFEVEDFYGKTVYSKNVTLNSLSGTEEVNIPDLSTGHYRLNVKMGESIKEYDFSVVCSLEERRNTENSQFAMASMASHTDYNKRNNMDEYSKMLVLSGINYVREFNLISSSVDENGEYKSSQALKKILESYKNHGIKVQYMLQNVPQSWLKENNGSGSENPNDLLKAYDYIKALCKDFCGYIDCLEILNETGINNGKRNNGADTYASFLKTAAIAASDADDRILISSAGMAVNNENYRRILFQNQINDYIDVYSFHTYSDVLRDGSYYDYSRFTGNFIDEANLYGLENKKMWLNEMGLSMFTDADELTKEQQQFQARKAPIEFIKHLGNGAEKAFWFIPGYRKENNIVLHGTTSQDGNPYPIYNSIATMTNIIGNAKYCGVVNGLPNGSYAHTFYDKDTDEGVIALWADAETDVTLRIGADSAVLCDIMGKEENVSSRNGIYKINAGESIKYIRFSGKPYSDYVNEDLLGKNKTDTGRSDFSNIADKIVIRPEFENVDESEVRTNGYMLDTENENILHVNVYNFNNCKTETEISVNTFGLWNVDRNVQRVEIEPMSTKSVTFRLSASEKLEGVTYKPIVISAVADGQNVSSAVCYVAGKYEYSDYLKNIPDFSVPSSWTKNISSALEMTITNEKESNGIGFDFKHKGGDWWAYPALNVPADGSFFKNTFGIYYMYKADRPVEQAVLRVYAYEEGGKRFDAYTNRLTVSDNKWNYVFFPWSDFVKYDETGNSFLNYENISKLEIGMSVYGETKDFKITLKDLGVVSYSDNFNENSVVSAEYDSGRIRVDYVSDKIPIVSSKIKIKDALLYGRTDGSTVYFEKKLPYGNYDAEIWSKDASGKMFYDKININVAEHSLVFGSDIKLKSGISYGKEKVTSYYIPVEDVGGEHDVSIAIGGYADNILKWAEQRSEVFDEQNMDCTGYIKQNEKTDSAKLFIWNNFNQMKPLSEPALINSEDGSEEYVNRVGIKEFYNPDKWKNNAPTGSLWKAENTVADEISFKMYIPSTNSSDSWVFPIFNVESGLTDTEGLAAVSFKIKSNQNISNVRVGLYLNESDGDSWFGYSVFSEQYINEDYKQIVFPLRNFDRQGKGDGVLDLTKLKTIQLGIYSTKPFEKKAFDISISDFGFLNK